MHRKLLTTENTALKFDDAREGVFFGYASVFGGVDAYGDTVMPGAYAKTLQSRQRPVQLRWNHYGGVIGKWTRMQEDEKGLYVEGELTPGHSQAMDVYASLKHGAISGLSIGYRPIKYEKNDSGGLNLQEIELVEVSVVESPADNAAQISDVKSAIEQADTLKEIETLLRDVGGFHPGAAKALISRVSALKSAPRDAEVDETELATAVRLKLNQLLSVI